MVDPHRSSRQPVNQCPVHSPCGQVSLAHPHARCAVCSCGGGGENARVITPKSGQGAEKASRTSALSNPLVHEAPLAWPNQARESPVEPALSARPRATEGHQGQGEQNLAADVHVHGVPWRRYHGASRSEATPLRSNSPPWSRSDRSRPRPDSTSGATFTMYTV